MITLQSARRQVPSVIQRLLFEAGTPKPKRDEIMKLIDKLFEKDEMVVGDVSEWMTSVMTVHDQHMKR